MWKQTKCRKCIFENELSKVWLDENSSWNCINVLTWWKEPSSSCSSLTGAPYPMTLYTPGDMRKSTEHKRAFHFDKIPCELEQFRVRTYWIKRMEFAMWMIQWCSRVYIYLQQKADGVFAGIEKQLMEGHTRDTTLQCISYCITHTQFMTYFLQSLIPVT